MENVSYQQKVIEPPSGGHDSLGYIRSKTKRINRQLGRQSEPLVARWYGAPVYVVAAFRFCGMTKQPEECPSLRIPIYDRHTHLPPKSWINLSDKCRHRHDRGYESERTTQEGNMMTATTDRRRLIVNSPQRNVLPIVNR
jgi:hypothetical protein